METVIIIAGVLAFVGSFIAWPVKGKDDCDGDERAW